MLKLVVPRALKDDEVLVRIVASGICLADLHFNEVSPEDAAGIPRNMVSQSIGHESEISTLLFDAIVSLKIAPVRDR